MSWNWSLKRVKSNAETHCLVLPVKARTGVHFGVLLPIHFAPLPHRVHAKNLADSAVRQPVFGQLWTASKEYGTTQTLPSEPLTWPIQMTHYSLFFLFQAIWCVYHNLKATLHYRGCVCIREMTNMQANCFEHTVMIKRLLHDCKMPLRYRASKQESGNTDAT